MIVNFNSPDAPKAIGPYSQSVCHGNTLYISGCLGIDPKVGSLVPGGTPAQAKQAMENIKTILNYAKYQKNLPQDTTTLTGVIKCTILLTDLSEFSIVNGIYSEYFDPALYPARICYEVKALPAGASVEIDAICSLD